MRKIFLAGFLLTVSVLAGSNCFANHLFGGELQYTHVSGNDYKVTLTVYGDCAAVTEGGAFDSLYDAAPLVLLKNGSSIVDTLVLHGEIIGIEVSPVCPGYEDSTTCNGGTLPGVKKFSYSATATLPGASADWAFVFYGQMGNHYAGRNSFITNITGPGSTFIYIEATLNNLSGDNSSPLYSKVPTPFYCVNVGEEYTQGTTDPDGDSLVYRLVPAIDGSTGSLVHYIAPYTAADPLETTGDFTFDSVNGRMTFTPSDLQRSLVVNEIFEYRHGILVGTSKREMTFVVLNNCSHNPPSATIDTSTVLGAAIGSGNEFSVCQGASSVEFELSASDSSGDSISVTTTDIPDGAHVVVAGDSTPHPVISFSWTTDTVSIGTYTFFITLKDNHCPQPGSQTIAYTINVVSRIALVDSIIYPTQCVHQALVQYRLSGGAAPRLLLIKEGGSTIRTYVDTTGIVIDSLPAGNYTAIVNTVGLSCNATFNFSVVDSGVLPSASIANVDHCIDDTASAFMAAPLIDSAVIYWYTTDNTLLAGPPTPNTSIAGTQTWYAIDQYKTCSSIPDTVQAIIHDRPQITIPDMPSSFCYADTVQLQASGGVTYTWSPAEDVYRKHKGDTDKYAIVFAPITYTVTVGNEFGCIDSATVTFSNIEQCCTFAYPTAFTPNNDGHNDRYRVVVYGNMQSYEFRIFNRWGQEVFKSENPGEGWDGYYNGHMADIGTYFYLLKAKCYTGHEEDKKGDFLLIR